MKRYMVIERFAPGGEAVYDRFARRGRLLPDGLSYIESWPNRAAGLCFQLMETEDSSLFETWIAKWSDIVEFEIIEIDRTPHD